MMFVLIGIATLMLVVNWTYLVLVNRHTFRLADMLALGAVSELLDEGQLLDAGAFAQNDDIAAAATAIDTPVTGLLARNNEGVGASLRALPSDLTIVAGHIDDANAPLSPANFTTTPAGNQPYNTLRVEILRAPSGANPVQLLIRGMGSPQAAKISAAAYATLDSRVVGFRPTDVVPSPVAPLAIQFSAWYTDRANGALDSNGNGRRELDVVLKPAAGGSTTANGALVGLDSGSSFSPTFAPDQIRDGIYPMDIAASGLLGPATDNDPLLLDAEQTSPANVAAIAAAFQQVAASADNRRIFPIYRTFSDPLDIVGWVAGRVLDADTADAGDGPRLRVRVEPEFLIHSTVVTARVDSTSADVPENLYIHKIRRTR
jgi:hypothetical protein